MTELRRVGVPFIRRRSGGGTVYHVSHLSVVALTKRWKERILGSWKFELLNPPPEIFIRPERFRKGGLASCPVPRGRRRERERTK